MQYLGGRADRSFDALDGGCEGKKGAEDEMFDKL